MDTVSSKKWLTLNQHGKRCLRAFVFALSASDLLTSQLYYLQDHDLVDRASKFKDAEERHPCAYYCLTDLGLHTVAHYFPKFDNHLNEKVKSLNQTKQ